MVSFHQKPKAGVKQTSSKSRQAMMIKEQIKPRLYYSRTLRKIASDFLIDFYESQIEWMDKPPSKKN